MPMPRTSRCSTFAALLLVALLGATPRANAAEEPPARVSVLTMGPGQHPFTRFGHNALLLEWASGRDAVYNFGTFEFDGLRGARDFMAGRFQYWLSVSDLESTLRAYGEANRSLTAQELALGPAERAELSRMLAINALPEHRYYAYDYYRDNCSTRVRDALDQVLGGGLSRQVVGAGRETYRQHTLRLVGASPLLFFGLDSALGRPTDRPISRWEELFLPAELHDQLASATHPTSSSPLVRAERELLTAREAPPAAATSRTLSYAALGAFSGLLLALLGRSAERSRAARLVLGLILALLGLALGLLGSVLLVFWGSKHWAAHDNPSILASPPWALALVWLGVELARGRHHATGLRVVLGVTVLTSIGLLALAVPAPHEPLRQAALFLPLWVGLLYGAGRPWPSRTR
jgi:Domain of unknown function (DUF4105)